MESTPVEQQDQQIAEQQAQLEMEFEKEMNDDGVKPQEPDHELL